MKNIFITFALLLSTISIFAQAPQSFTGIGGTSSNASAEMARGFETNVRNAWLNLDNKVQVTVPSTGKYLILVGLRVTNFTSNDKPYFKITNAVSGDLASSVVISDFSSEKDAENSSFFVRQLTKGNTIRLEGKLSPLNANNPATNQVLFQEGRLSIIRIE